jgi:glutaredoxin
MTTVVTLYTRPGCHLCDRAREAIERLRHELPPFELTEVDIDRDEALLARFLERIPVVVVEGRVVSELEFDPRLLRARLDTVRR